MFQSRLLLVLLALVPVGLASAANIQGPRRSALERLDEGDAIRQRLLLRGGRFEIRPTFGFTLNDPFQRNTLLGAQAAYHLNDAVAIGVTGFYGIAVKSDLADQIASNEAERGQDEGSFSNLQLLVSADLIYTPITGKFALFGRSVFNYDIHALVGIGAVSLAGSSDLEGFKPAPVLGLGMRTFLTNGMAITFEVRDYIFSSALNATNETDTEGGTESVTAEEFSNNLAVTVGLGFYFPQEAKISK